MKLYKPVEASEIFRTGITHKPATLSDIRAAAKEMGYALVPLADLNALEVGTDAYEYLDGNDARSMADGIYDLIEAAEKE